MQVFTANFLSGGKKIYLTPFESNLDGHLTELLYSVCY